MFDSLSTASISDGDQGLKKSQNIELRLRQEIAIVALFFPCPHVEKILQDWSAPSYLRGTFGGGMNWTTTTVPLWQIDCEAYRKVGKPFELRDVTMAEHLQFAEVFAARYDLKFSQSGTTVRFEP